MLEKNVQFLLQPTFRLTLLFDKGWGALPGNVPHLEHTHLSLETIKTNTVLSNRSSIGQVMTIEKVEKYV